MLTRQERASKSSFSRGGKISLEALAFQILGYINHHYVALHCCSRLPLACFELQGPESLRFSDSVLDMKPLEAWGSSLQGHATALAVFRITVRQRIQAQIRMCNASSAQRCSLLDTVQSQPLHSNSTNAKRREAENQQSRNAQKHHASKQESNRKRRKAIERSSTAPESNHMTYGNKPQECLNCRESRCVCRMKTFRPWRSPSCHGMHGNARQRGCLTD